MVAKQSIPETEAEEVGSALSTVASMIDTEPADIEDDELDTTVGAVSFSSKTDFDPEDIAYPRIRIMQPMSEEVDKEVAKAGDFLLSGYKPVKKITFVPLMKAKTRIYAVGSGKERRTLCSSPDALHGNGNPVELRKLPDGDTYNGVCDTCPFNVWRSNPSGNGKNLPPLCDVHQKYIGYVSEFKTLVEMDFKKTSLQTAKNLNTLLVGRGFGSVVVEFMTTKQTSSQSAAGYFVPQFTIIDEPNESILQAANRMIGRNV